MCFTTSPEWSIEQCALTMEVCSCYKTADALRRFISQRRHALYGSELENFYSLHTFVTDCAAMMPAIFETSVSPSHIPSSERWVLRVCQLLSTAMQHAMESIRSSTIQHGFTSLKMIVTLFKKESIIDHLSNDFKLAPECPTRFGTTFDVVEQFLKLYHLLDAITDETCSISLRSAKQ